MRHLQIARSRLCDVRAASYALRRARNTTQLVNWQAVIQEFVYADAVFVDGGRLLARRSGRTGGERRRAALAARAGRHDRRAGGHWAERNGAHEPGCLYRHLAAGAADRRRHGFPAGSFGCVLPAADRRRRGASARRRPPSMASATRRRTPMGAPRCVGLASFSTFSCCR